MADSRGQSVMDFQAFFDCMFECADMWVDSIDGLDYARFLQGIWDSTKGVSGSKKIGSIGMWRAAKSMLSAPKLLYENGGYDMQNFEERKRVTSHSVKEIIKIVDRHNSNGMLTVTEMQGYLANTAFSGFSDWMTKVNRRNWARYDDDKDGRIDRRELYNAMMGFLTSDGYGRDLCEESYGGDDGNDSTTTWKPGTKRIARAPASVANATQPAVSVQRTASFGPGGAAGASGEGSDESSGMWWIHMKNLGKCLSSIEHLVTETENHRGKLGMRPHTYLQTSLVLTDAQEKQAKKEFRKHDLTGDDCLDKRELYVALGCLLQAQGKKMSGDDLKALLDEKFRMADTDGDECLGFHEFLKLYNELWLDNLGDMNEFC